MQRNVMNSGSGATCNERGYVCDIQPKFISNITREVDPSTGTVIREKQVCQAFYQCIHCNRTITLGIKEGNVDDVITFDMIAAERQTARQQEFAQEAQTRSGR